MKRKLRLGLLGTGVAATHLYQPAWPKLRDKIELVACANRTRAKAEAYARSTGIPKVVDSAEELLALEEVEAVLISLPIAEQPDWVLSALRQGKAVISEKPVAPSVVVGRRLIRAAVGRSVPWLVAENFAFMPHLLKLRTWLERGRLGDIQLAQVTQVTVMDKTNPYFNTAWRTQPKHQGSYVVDGGVHLAHVLRRLLGMPMVVKSLNAHLNRQLPPPDSAVAALSFPSGALGTWCSCHSARYDGPMLRLFGTKGSAELFYGHVLLREAKGRETVFESPVSSFEAQFAHFADVVLRGAPPAVTPEEALLDLQLISTIAGTLRKPMRR